MSAPRWGPPRRMPYGATQFAFRAAGSGGSTDFPFVAGPTALPAAARALKPCGISSRRSAAQETGLHARTTHSSLDGSRRFFPGPPLGAGPRAPRPRPRPALAPLPVARAAAGDNGNFARDGRTGPDLIFATAGLPAIAASDTPPVGIHHCSIGPEGNAAETAARIPSTGNGGASSTDKALALMRQLKHPERDPRELLLPTGHVSETRLSLLRDIFTTPPTPPGRLPPKLIRPPLQVATPSASQVHLSRHRPMANWPCWPCQTGLLSDRH